MAGGRVALGRVRKDSALLTASASMTQSSMPVASLRRLLPPCRCASANWSAIRVLGRLANWPDKDNAKRRVKRRPVARRHAQGGRWQGGLRQGPGRI